MDTKQIKTILSKIEHLPELDLYDTLSRITTLKLLTSKEIETLRKLDFFGDIVTQYHTNLDATEFNLLENNQFVDFDGFKSHLQNIIDNKYTKNPKLSIATIYQNTKNSSGNEELAVRRAIERFVKYEIADIHQKYSGKWWNQLPEESHRKSQNLFVENISRITKPKEYQTQKLTDLPTAIYSNDSELGEALNLFRPTTELYKQLPHWAASYATEFAKHPDKLDLMDELLKPADKLEAFPKMTRLESYFVKQIGIDAVNPDFTRLEAFEIFKLSQWAKALDNTIPNSQLVSALTSLIYMQSAEQIKKSQNADKPDNPAVEPEANVSKDVQYFMNAFDPQLSTDSTKRIRPELTYLEFKDFLNSIEQNTNIDTKVINWLIQDSNNNDMTKDDKLIIKMLLQSMNLNALIQRTSKSEVPDDIKIVLDDLNKDDGFKSNYRIRDIYQVNATKHNSRYEPKNSSLHIKHKYLTHGTNNSSILTILRDGLLRRCEINADAQVSLTGLGLGDGIYFARPDQAGKSISYSGSSANVIYLFIADVAYTTEFDVNKYGDFASEDWDLLHANEVGAYDRDELVARDSAQVEIKYMLAISTK